MELYDFQRKAVDAARAAIGERPLICSPTGSGKSFMGATLVREMGVPTLWLAHREELIDQAAEELRDQGLSVGMIVAGRPRFPKCMVQVASIQTIVRRELPYAELVVVDECRHACAPNYIKILNLYSKAYRLGLDATPMRLDGRPLGDVFGKIIIAAYMDDLCRDGTLIEPRVYAPPGVDMSGVGMRAGDYDTKKLRAACDRPKLVGDIVETWQRRAAGKRTVAFAVDIEHSKHIVAGFKAAGVPAEHLDGKMPKQMRRDILSRIASGETLVVSQCALLIEGWNLKCLECAIMARPTASLCLYLQSAGRITRSCPGKTQATILDHAGNFLRHGRVTRRIEYSLTGHIAFKAKEPLGLRTCPECYRMFLSTRAACPECGHEMPVSERDMIESVEGELVEQTPEVAAEMAAEARNTLLTFEEKWWNRESVLDEAKGRRPQQTAFRFKSVFGHWPTWVEVGGEARYVHPLTADDAVRVATLAKFAALGEAKKLKAGFARVRYKGVFGHWPTKAVIEGAG